MKRPYSSFSSSTCDQHGFEYEVFLNFRGKDTRKNFISHLDAALRQNEINTFFDDDNLSRGESIAPELLKAIETSRCSVVVISENYAGSRWCLDELVKILQCKKDCGQFVYPIFYHVDPSHVRHQKGSIGEALQKYEQDSSPNSEKVQSWRHALTEVGNLAGCHVHDRSRSHTRDHCSDIKKLGSCTIKHIRGHVGMDSRLQELDSCVQKLSMDGIGFIGICGMGGIGKTTLARAYYDWMASQFHCRSFLANVREVCENDKNGGLVHLQNSLLKDILSGQLKKVRDVYEGKAKISNRLKHKKVLIVLDDVNDQNQLEALADNGSWFGPGSRILITTRDEHLVRGCRIYRIRKLNNEEGLQLFCWKAFKGSHPPEDDIYTELCKQVVAYANGLPLALEVLGSLLCGRDLYVWVSALRRLKDYPEDDIFRVLRVSYDGLKEEEQKLFLDIACFFNGSYKDYVVRIMDGCNFHPIIGISRLIDKSLIYEGSNNEIRMHDLLEEMGKAIVREKSRGDPGRCSRIWDFQDLCRVLQNNEATEEVEAIVSKEIFSTLPCIELALSNMKKLRLLILYCVNYDGINDLPYLSNKLQILSWTHFPFKSLPSRFAPDGLVELTLVSSRIELLWNSVPIKPLNNLKTINLSYSDRFRKFEDFKVVPNLEKLILRGCISLEEVHPSITLLRSLAVLDLTNCTCLVNLPRSINGLTSLKVLKLSGCVKIGYLPKDLGHLNSLEKLHLDETCVKNLKLQARGLEHGKWKKTFNIIIERSPTSSFFYSLKKLPLKVVNLTEFRLWNEVSSEDLVLKRNNFSSLPASLNKLTKLKNLYLNECELQKSLGTELPPSLERVTGDECTSLCTFLDPSNEDLCDLHCTSSFLYFVKLARKQGSKRTAFASLKRYLQNPSNPSKRFEFFLPGNSSMV